MKPVLHTAFLAAIIGAISCAIAAETNQVQLALLVEKYLPGAKVETGPSGKPQALVTRNGERLDLTEISKEHPTPSRQREIGYWYTPTMDWLGRQNIRVTTPAEANDVVRLWHNLWRGPSFAPQKLYDAQRFGPTWVVTVDHDFTNYPGNIMVTMPYELVVNEKQILQSFRQRCYGYPGSAQIYTNTIQTVYDREIRLNKGRNYPEVLFEELRQAWEKEKIDVH